MKKDVKVTMKAKIDELEMEFYYDGLLILDNPKVLKFTEVLDNRKVDTAVIFEDTITISRSNGVEMFQEFIEGKETIMDYTTNDMVFEFNVFTKSIINQEGYLKIVYSTDTGDIKQSHVLEIYYT